MRLHSDVRATGWLTFAGTLVVLAGIFTFIDGIVAVANTRYLNSDLLFGGLKSWGWAMLVIGVLQFTVGLAILVGQTWAAWAGIVLASLNAIGELLFLRSYPVWSIIIIAVDLLVIYGLAVYCLSPADE